MFREWIRMIIGFVALCVVTGGTTVFWRIAVQPIFSNSTARFTNEEAQAISLPWSKGSASSQKVDVHTEWDETNKGTTSYDLHTFALIENMSLNGKAVKMMKDTNRFVLSNNDASGHVALDLQLRNSFYFLRHFIVAIRRSITNPWITLQYILSVALLTGLATGLLRWMSKDMKNLPTVSIVLGGALLVAWSFATPNWAYSYDWHGHAEYIQYIIDHWTIPEAQSGWQTYQPPLYYYLCALWLSGESIVGIVPAIEDLQGLSIVLSFLTLFIGWKISYELWPTDARKQALFTAAIATFPGIVFLSSQISNDTLITTISFAWILMMIRWENSGKLQWWILGACLAGAGILTKSTGLFLVIAQILIVGTSGVYMKKKVHAVLQLLVIVSLLCGWLIVLRFWIQGETSIVGNIKEIYPFLSVDNTFSHLFAFNPIVVLVYPFNHDFLGVRSNEYFWEYFFRSALFGSYDYKDSLENAIGLVLSALSLLPIAVYGLVQSRLLKGWRTLVCTSFIFLLAIFCYRLVYPMTSNQHFRFVTILAVPFSAFVVLGIHHRKRWIADIALCLVLGCITCSVLFFAGVITN